MSTFVVLVGTIEPDSIKTAQVGTPPKSVTNFRIATSPGWYTCAAWSELSAKVPAPGSTVLVTGRLSGRSYESDKYHDAEGKPAKINVTEIVASSIEQIGAPSAAVPEDDLFS